MKTQNNQNGGLNSRRPIPATMRGTERTEVMPSPVPAPKQLGQERKERDMRFWLQLTPEVRATYMSMAHHPASSAGQILRKAVELAKIAEMPSVNDF